MLIKDWIAILKPQHALDVGCREGGYTARISEHCGKITAIDNNPRVIEKARTENSRANIEYAVMDGCRLDFPDGMFDLVYERASLHHIKEWQAALDEMLRVSSDYILIEEPLDDPRSRAKKNAIKAQDFFLGVQNESGFSHFKFHKVGDFQAYFDRKGMKIESEITKSDKPVDFNVFFEPFEEFARKTDRYDYWMNRLAEFRAEMRDEIISESDILFIMSKKK